MAPSEEGTALPGPSPAAAPGPAIEFREVPAAGEDGSAPMAEIRQPAANAHVSAIATPRRRRSPGVPATRRPLPGFLAADPVSRPEPASLTKAGIFLERVIAAIPSVRRRLPINRYSTCRGSTSRACHESPPSLATKRSIGPLNLVENHPPAGRGREHFSRERGGVARLPQHLCRREEIDRHGIRQNGSEPRALAGTARAEKEEGFPGSHQIPCKHRGQIYRIFGVEIYRWLPQSIASQGQPGRI